MTTKRPTTFAEYIDAAPPTGRPHLTKLYNMLERVAPEAQQVIKWGIPFFVEPRFLFSFSAHKRHLGLATSNAALAPYRDRLVDFEITQRGILKLPYNKPFPETLIRQIATTNLQLVSARQDNRFW